MRLRPLNDTLVVKLDEDEWNIQRPELVEIPDAVIGRYKKKARSGIVISWGSRCHYAYKEGQRVYFGWCDQRPGVKIDGVDYRFVKEYEVIAGDDDVRS